MSRHIVICRESNAEHASKQEFVTLEHQSSEDGWTWAKSNVHGSMLQANVNALLARIEGVTPDLLPDITITRRTAEEVAASPPLTGCKYWYGPLLDTQPGVSISILAPVVFEQGQRTRFEHWTSVSRSMGGSDRSVPMIHCGGHQYIARTLGQQILRFYNAADDRVGYSGDTFKAWAGRACEDDEIWVRPSLEVGGPEFLPAVFPPPNALPTYTPEVLDKRARDAKVRQSIKQHKSMRASQGYVFNQQRQSWGKPE